MYNWSEVLPKIERDYKVRFTTDPEGRATMGGSSGAAAAFTMAWFHPELYRRVLSYSGTFVELDNGATRDEASAGNWVLANQRMAAALKAKGYSYQYVFSEGARHTDANVILQTLPRALEWLWQGCCK